MPSTMTLDQLAPTFTGQLLQPTDAGDDEARRVHARRRSQRRWTRNDRWRSDDRSRTDEGHSRRPGQAHQLATTSPSELQRTQEPLRRPKLLPLQVRIVCAIYLAHAPVSALTKSSRLSAPGRSPDTDVSPRRLSSLQAAVRNRARPVERPEPDLETPHVVSAGRPERSHSSPEPDGRHCVQDGKAQTSGPRPCYWPPRSPPPTPRLHSPCPKRLLTGRTRSRPLVRSETRVQCYRAIDRRRARESDKARLAIVSIPPH
jgi:hypothetical protein